MMFARYIETTDAGTVIVRAGVDGQMHAELPSTVLAHEAFSLVASYYELESARAPLTIVVLGPDMQEIATENGYLQLEGAMNPNFPGFRK